MWRLVFILFLFIRIPVVSLEHGCDHQCLSLGSCKSKKFEDTCYYYFIDSTRKWENTMALCKSENLTMVNLHTDVIRNVSRLNQLVKTLDLSSSSVWLGGKVQDLQRWQYVSGEPFSGGGLKYSPSFLSTEGRTSKHMCGIISTRSSNLEIDAEGCIGKHAFICRTENASQERHIMPVRHELKTWYEARSWCITKHGGDLLYLNHGENYQGLMKNTLNSLKNKKFFIGLRHKIWKWQDDREILPLNWNEGEPNGLDENCLMMYYDGKWNDVKCSTDTILAFCQQKTQKLGPETGMNTPATKTLPAPSGMYKFPRTVPSSTTAPKPTNHSVTERFWGGFNTSLVLGISIPTAILVVSFIGCMIMMHRKMQVVKKQASAVSTQNNNALNRAMSLSSQVTLNHNPSRDGQMCAEQPTYPYEEIDTEEEEFYENKEEPCAKEEELYENKQEPSEKEKEIYENAEDIYESEEEVYENAEELYENDQASIATHQRNRFSIHGIVTADSVLEDNSLAIDTVRKTSMLPPVAATMNNRSNVRTRNNNVNANGSWSSILEEINRKAMKKQQSN